MAFRTAASVRISAVLIPRAPSDIKALARIGAVGGVGNGALLAELVGGRGDCQPQFVVARVVTEGHRRAVFGAQSSQRAENHILRTGQPRRLPAHTGILSHPEQIAAGPLAEHLGRQG